MFKLPFQSIWERVFGSPQGSLAGEYSLNLDFALSKYLDPRVTSTRASAGTYFDAAGVLQSAANDVARFDHDPSTLVSKGLLIEEARTNLLLRSEEFDNSYWAKTNSTVTPNSASSPSGTNTACLWTRSSTAAAFVGRSLTKAASALPHSTTFFVKKNVGSYCALRLQGSYPARSDIVLNLDTGVIHSGPTNTSGFTGAVTELTRLKDGWYRLGVSATTDATTGLSAYISFNSNGVSTDGTDSAANSSGYTWGAQLEAGAFATSYIPTTTVAATRAADVVSMTGTNFSSWFNASEGTFVCKWSQEYTDGAFGAKVIFCVNDGTTSNRVAVITTTTAVDGRIVVAGVATNPAQKAIGPGTHTSSIGVKASSASQYTDGDLNSMVAPSSYPSVNRLEIGSQLGATFLNGHIARLTYYPTRLSNSILQGLSL